VTPLLAVVESTHCAVSLHGLLMHAVTSMSQLPPYPARDSLSVILHWLKYCDRKPCAHVPFPYPALHEQR
jgi:hypothetical protein